MRESGSAQAVTLWQSATTASSSRLTYVEARSALARGVATRRLRTARLGHAKAKLELLMEQLRLVEPTASVIRAAGQIAEEYGLRAYDAVHLASALSLGDRQVVVATWDADLARAAREVGLAVAVSAVERG